MRNGRLQPLWWSGVLGPALIALAAIAASLVQDDPDVRRNFLSEHGAATVDKAWLWNILVSIGGILIVLGAAAAFVGLGRGLRPRAAAVLIAMFGAGLALEGAFFQLDCRESDAGCAGRESYSWRHEAHGIEGGLGFLAVFVAAILLATWFRGRGPRTLFFASSFTALVLVALVVGWELIADSSWGGLIQRVLVAIILLWVALVSYHVGQRRA